jgi:hypothetical protein
MTASEDWIRTLGWIALAEALGEITIHQTQNLSFGADWATWTLTRIPAVEIEMHPRSAHLYETTQKQRTEDGA